MRINYCDICESILKPNEEKVILVTSKTIHNEENRRTYYSSYEDYFRALRQKEEEMDVKEICLNCYSILQDLFTMRLNGRKYIEKKILKDLGISKNRKKYKRRNKNGKKK